MRSLIKEYFRLGRAERRGFMSLTALLLVMLVFRIWFLEDMFKPDPGELAAIKRSLSQAQAEESHLSEINEAPNQKKISFLFDPNKCPKDSLILLGFSKKIATRIISYRNAGGVFRDAKDLARIYGIDSLVLNNLLPFVRIEVKSSSSTWEARPPIKKETEKTIHTLDINTADSAQLVTLKRIGPVLASRIIRYREKLGGFVSTEQLREVYGIAPEILEINKSRVSIVYDSLRSLNLNAAGYQDLRNHPYLNPKLASAIVRYREQHGRFDSISEIKKIHLMSDSIFEKIGPYLSIRPETF